MTHGTANGECQVDDVREDPRVAQERDWLVADLWLACHGLGVPCNPSSQLMVDSPQAIHTTMMIEH